MLQGENLPLRIYRKAQNHLPHFGKVLACHDKYSFIATIWNIYFIRCMYNAKKVSKV